MRGFIAAVACFFLILPAWGQWQPQMTGTDVQLRGISAVSDTVVWASGAKGTVLRTIDGGEGWVKVPVAGAEALDFRDVQGIDANTAFVLSIGPGEQSRIYKTTDGGKSWQLQFINKDPKAFYDCFAFWDSKHGIALSDSVDGKFPLISTNDGVTWTHVPVKNMPAALPKEGAFAASGTCIATYGKKDVWFGTGGPAARVFHSGDRGKSWTVAETPIIHGEASQGVFSVFFANEKEGVAVGGDYQQPGKAEKNAAVTHDGGKGWFLSSTLPRGYRSALAAGAFNEPPNLDRPAIIAVGTNGTDFSGDGKNWTATLPGNPWSKADNSAYNAVSCVGDACWAAGPQGRIGKLLRPPLVINN